MPAVQGEDEQPQCAVVVEHRDGETVVARIAGQATGTTTHDSRTPFPSSRRSKWGATSPDCLSGKGDTGNDTSPFPDISRSGTKANH